MSNSEVFNEDWMQVMARYPDKYFKLGNERFERETAQGSLFT